MKVQAGKIGNWLRRQIIPENLVLFALSFALFAGFGFRPVYAEQTLFTAANQIEAQAPGVKLPIGWIDDQVTQGLNMHWLSGSSAIHGELCNGVSEIVSFEKPASFPLVVRRGGPGSCGDYGSQINLVALVVNIAFWFGLIFGGWHLVKRLWGMKGSGDDQAATAG